MKEKTIHGKGWKHSRNISYHKYAVISMAILDALSSQPVSYTELVMRIEKKVKKFEGSIGWYAISCLRELECTGKVIRIKGKSVMYRKA